VAEEIRVLVVWRYLVERPFSGPPDKMDCGVQVAAGLTARLYVEEWPFSGLQEDGT
jgi:hypothetical protein